MTKYEAKIVKANKKHKSIEQCEWCEIYKTQYLIAVSDNRLSWICLKCIPKKLQKMEEGKR